MVSPPSPTPPATLRASLVAWVGSALVAGLVIGALDVGLTLAGGTAVSFAQATLFGGLAIVLLLAAAVLVGTLEGVVAYAIRATHPGPTLFARLRDDPDFDREATGALVAGLLVSAAFAFLVSRLAWRLVAIPERKQVGVLILGAFAAAALPLFLLLAYPVHRVTRRIAALVPRLGRVPRALVAALLGIALAFTVGAVVVVTRLDWRALPLGTGLAALGFFVVQGVVLAFSRRPLRARLVAFGAAAALAGAAVGVLLTRPDERTAALLAVESRAARSLVGIARAFFDRDGDGFSTVLGGGDCDDHRADVHPGARDEPGNGIDENCLGGDAERPAEAPRDAAPPPVAGGLRWKGNMLIVLVDTVRADRLGAAGYRRAGKSLTPRLDALVDKGVYFTRAYAQAPNTPRSFPSIMTGRLPSQIAWAAKWHNFPPVTDENVTLFENLRDAGLYTTGFASHFYFVDGRGATQGFQEFDNEGALNIAASNTDIASPRIVPRALARLKELGAKKQRFAMFVHLFEPHSRYMEHEEFPISGKGVEGLEEKYDYEIAYVDRWIGELVDGLAAAGVAEDTMVVVLSDHGEAFGKHRSGGERMFFHGQTLYDELLRVPLLFVIPGATPRKIDTPVSLVDLAPTLAELAGVPAKGATGRSLAGALAGEPLPPKAITAELIASPSWDHSAKMMLDADGKTKVYYRISDNVFELYDVAADPDEQRNLAEGQPELLARMKAAITKWMESEL